MVTPVVTWTRTTTGLATAGEKCVELFGARGGRVLVWCHSTGRTSDQAAANSPTYGSTVHRILATMAQAGYTVVAGDLGKPADTDGGVDKFGNSGAVDRVQDLLAYARSALGASTDPAVITGHSQGGFTALNVAHEIPDDVAAVVTFAGATNGDAVYATSAPLAAMLDVAFGGSWAANGNPTRDPIGFADDLADLPYLGLYGETDPVIPAAGNGSQAAFVAAIDGQNATALPVAGDHVGMLANVEPLDIVSWLLTRAAP